MTDTLKKKIEACTTRKQLESILKKAGLKIVKDDTKEFNSLSVWINDTTRIYKPYNRKNLVVQAWKKVEFKASGVPTFFSNPSIF